MAYSVGQPERFRPAYARVAPTACFDCAETDIDNKRSLHEETSARSVNELSQVRQRFSAVRLPMPGSNFTMRLNATSSRGLDTKRMNEVTSLICACSKNLMPLVI